jgi:hypothetical protein
LICNVAEEEKTKNSLTLNEREKKDKEKPSLYGRQPKSNIGRKENLLCALGE